MLYYETPLTGCNNLTGEHLIMFSGQCLTKLFDFCIKPENFVPCCCEPAQFIGMIPALLIPHLWCILVSIFSVTVVPHADQT